MSSIRESGWKDMEIKYRSSVAHQFARYALGLSFNKLPKDVVHQAKRSLLDTLGCAIGAFDAPGRPICEAVIKELGGKEESTVFCSGLQTNALNATLVNSFLVRFLDANDIGVGGHNSDAIPAILAVAEREKTNGKKFLTSIVAAYELGSRVIESARGKAEMEAKGFATDNRGNLSMPPALGILLGLNESQIANAIGVCASGGLALNIVDADSEENFMKKNLRFGWIAYEAILSTLLARQGFTGPVDVIEGDSGWQDLFHGDLDINKLTDFTGWRILKTRHKCFCANGTSLAHIAATLALVEEHKLKPQDIASVNIKTCGKEARHTTTFTKKYPRTAENADHSSYYQTAYVIKERSFGVDSIRPHNFTDPVILELIEKITVEADHSLPDLCYTATSEITTKDGRNLKKHIDCVHGFGDDPLTDAELEHKFRDLTKNYISEKQAQKIIDACWNVENLEKAGELANLMVVPR